MLGHILVAHVHVSYKLIRIFLLFCVWSQKYFLFQRQYLQVIHSYSRKISKMVDTWLSGGGFWLRCCGRCGDWLSCRGDWLSCRGDWLSRRGGN